MVEGQHIIVAEIIEDLQATLEELQNISDDLALTPGDQEGDPRNGKRHS